MSFRASLSHLARNVQPPSVILAKVMAMMMTASYRIMLASLALLLGVSCDGALDGGAEVDTLQDSSEFDALAETSAGGAARVPPRFLPHRANGAASQVGGVVFHKPDIRGPMPPPLATPAPPSVDAAPGPSGDEDALDQAQAGQTLPQGFQRSGVAAADASRTTPRINVAAPSPHDVWWIVNGMLVAPASLPASPSIYGSAPTWIARPSAGRFLLRRKLQVQRVSTWVAGLAGRRFTILGADGRRCQVTAGAPFAVSIFDDRGDAWTDANAARRTVNEAWNVGLAAVAAPLAQQDQDCTLGDGGVAVPLERTATAFSRFTPQQTAAGPCTEGVSSLTGVRLGPTRASRGCRS